MPLRDDLLTPIPGANPSGTNLRYDPVTDKVKEARREDLDVPQGAWKSSLKVADYPQVIKLAGEAVAKRSKDLQLAVWLVDAHIKREGFAITPACFNFLRDLLDQFWDTIYPEIEDGDLEMRAAPLDWLGARLDEPLRLLPVTSSGFSWAQYKESRSVGYEADATTEDKRRARKQLIDDGKLTAEEFDQAVDETPKLFCEAMQANISKGLDALEELTGFLDEKFGDLSPSFIKTKTALEDVAQVVRMFIVKKGGPTPRAVPQPEPVPEPAAQPPSEPPPAVPVAAPAPPPVQYAQPAQPPPAPATASIVPTNLEDAAKRVAAIARYMRGADVYDISPYLILRGYRWGEIRYNGPEIDASMLMPPFEETREALAAAYSAGQFKRVLGLTEEAMELPCGRGWLDLQRYTVKALEGKGQYFAFVADAVRTGVRGLIQDLPGLLEMSLRDGSPTADPETLAWIEDEVLSGVPVVRPYPSPAAPVSAAAPEPELAELPAIDLSEKPPAIDEEPLGEADSADVFDQALQAARNGRHAEALDLLARQLASERSGRGRFKRRVQIAHLLAASGRERIARPILEELAAEIEHRGLEEWEDREAVAYPLSLLLRCAADQDEESRRKTYARICRLDPVRALEMSE
jgi:type VI secretion system protein ImpA